MSFIQPKPEPFRAGQSGLLSAGTLNQIVQAVVRQIRGGGDTNTQYYGDRVVVSSESIGPLQADVANYQTQFVVLEEADDYLICAPFVQPSDATNLWTFVPYDPLLEEGSVTRIIVAKPYLLQRSPWDNRTVIFNGVNCLYTYTGVIGERTAYEDGIRLVTQHIQPSYVPGDVILATKAPTGYVDPTLGVPVVWMDDNTAARKWLGLGNDLSGDSLDDALVVGLCNIPMMDQWVFGPGQIGSDLYLRPMDPPGGLEYLSLASGGYLQTGTTYYYAITAISHMTGGTIGETIKFVANNTPLVPQGPDRSINLIWGEQPRGIGYRIYRTTDFVSGGPVFGPTTLLVEINGPWNTTFTDDGSIQLQTGTPPAYPGTAGIWAPRPALEVGTTSEIRGAEIGEEILYDGFTLFNVNDIEFDGTFFGWVSPVNEEFYDDTTSGILYWYGFTVWDTQDPVVPGAVNAIGVTLLGVETGADTGLTLAATPRVFDGGAGGGATISIVTASTSTAGVVSTADQSFAGRKTFGDGVSVGNSLDILGSGVTFATLLYASGLWLTAGTNNFLFDESAPRFIVGQVGILSLNNRFAVVDTAGLLREGATATTGSLVFYGGIYTGGTLTVSAGSITGTVNVNQGGTGATSFTAYGPVAGGTTSTGPLQSLGVGTSGQFLVSNGPGTLATWQTITVGSGTVTSVGISGPSGISWANSPVTTSGTLTGTWSNQSANVVFAGPSSGGATTPTFRSLVEADMTLSDITTNNASITAHGFLRKLDNTATHYLDGTGAWSVPAGTGTVTSFSAGTLSPLFTTGVATATTTPALSFTAVSQNANIVFAGPATGGAAAPTFRALVAADIPAVTEGMLSLSDVTTDNVSSTAHGFAPKSPADTTKFLNGATTPAYAQVKDSDLSLSDITTNNSSVIQHGFLPKLGGGTTNFLRADGTWAAPPAGTTYTADETTLHLAAGVFSIISTYTGQTSITTLGTITTGTWNGTVVAVGKGGTGANLSATGGTGQYVKQSGVGAAFTVGAISSSDLPSGVPPSGVSYGSSWLY